MEALIMNLFKKIFSLKKDNSELSETAVSLSKDINELSLDEIFVHNFIKKGGRFLYCASFEEVNQNLLNIIEENCWEEILCLDRDLQKLINIINKKSTQNNKANIGFFTLCEQLICDNGGIMFSSNQVQQHKLSNLPNSFIVLARTSQLVRNTDEALMALRKTYEVDFPSNISSIKNYTPGKADEDFLSYGNSNAKNLYLLLLEDL